MYGFKNILLCLLVCACCRVATAQDVSASVFSKYDYTGSAKRKILSLKDKPFIQKINPLTYAGAGLLFFYQRIVSEQIQASCMYVTSCSAYTKNCIERYGIIKGSLIGLHQMYHCHGSVYYDYPLHKHRDNKILNE